jgi:hypothetical protein
MSSADDLQIGAGTPAIMMKLEPHPERNLDEAAPVIHPAVEELVGKPGTCQGAPLKGAPAGATEIRHFSLMEVRPFLKSINARLTRKRYAETTLREYLSQIQPTELTEKYLEFYDAHPFHKEVCAGAKHHHWWKGGLEDHLREMIGIGFDIMELYPGDFNFSKSDLIIAVFLHDFGKI